MNDKKINLTKFEPYIDRAIEGCKKLSFAEKTRGLWSEPEIMDYFLRTSSDEPNSYLASTIKEIFPDSNGKKVLCIGGGTGKLGRNILKVCPNVYVTEIDSSKEMTTQANALAHKNNIDDHFISIEADARSLPFADGEFDYAIAYGVFRYIDSSDHEIVLSEIGRVSDYNFIVSEPILKELIYSLPEKLHGQKTLIKETPVSMFRMSLFYMLFKEYKSNADFKALTDSETDKQTDFIEVLSSAAGMTAGTLYELRVRNEQI